MSKHPMQKIISKNGVVRFQENEIVRYLLNNGGIDLNFLGTMPFSDEDSMQFAQLIGYSISNYLTLSYVTEKGRRKADKRRASFLKAKKPT